MKKTATILALLILLITSMSFATVTNPTHPGAGPYATIQAAIDNAATVNGDVLNVGAGTYIESVVVNKSVIITGAGNTTTFVNPAIDQNGFLITASNVTIQNLRVNLNTSGVDAQAIRLQAVNFVTITNNVIVTTGNLGVGIWVGNIGFGNSNNLTISNNGITITNQSTGIYAEGGSTAQTGWTVWGNAVTANLGNPIELYDVTNSTVNLNAFVTTSSGGANVIWNSELAPISNLIFTNNNIVGSNGSQVVIGTDLKDAPLDPGNAFIGSITTVTVTGNTFSLWASRALRFGAIVGAGTVTAITINTNTFQATVNTGVIGGPSTDKTGTGNIFNVSPPATIQQSINSALSNATINVAAGTYTEDLFIPAANTNLDISGAGSGTTTIKGVQHGAVPGPLALPNIDILASGVKVHGFTIAGPNYAAGFYSSGMIIGATNVEIYNNAFQVTPGAIADEISQAIQTYRTLVLVPVDISGLNIHNNTFTHLSAGAAGYEGIWVNVDDSPVSTITIQNNTFSGNVLRAITTERSKALISTNSIITDLAPGSYGVGGWQGINVGGANSGSVTNVTVDLNTIKGSGPGKGFSYGIKFGFDNTSTFSTVVASNNIIQMNLTGVWVRYGASGVSVSPLNDISGNTNFGLDNTDPTLNVVTATGNWWGHASGPFNAATNPSGTGDDVSNFVNYSGWIGNSPGAPHPWTWTVNSGGDIDDIIALATAGDIINISAGTYAAFTVNKAVTINATGNVFILNGSPAITVSSTGVTITGLTFNFGTPDWAIDVLAGAYDVSISDNDFLTTNGVRNQGTGIVTASYNYWNTPWGPTIASNPSGNGSSAANTSTGTLDYRPWWADLGHSVPLQVELTSFSASMKNNAVDLLWKTASEVNNFGFEIQRSAKNGSFSKVGFVTGNGNSNSEKVYKFTDSSPLAGKVQYRLKQIDNDGKFEYSDIVDINVETPTSFVLNQNYPNPFNPSTLIRYAIPYESSVNIQFYNSIGECVRDVNEGTRQAGYYELNFTSSGLASGIYFYSVTAVSTDGKSNFRAVKKMTLMK